jgi:OOP family OmpA-OmpF porin
VPGFSDESRSDPVPAAATSIGLVRRRPGLAWLLAALVIPVLLTALMLAVRTGPTEDDLQNRSQAALAARGITGVRVQFSGRDATVVVPAGMDADEARNIVAAVDGVRAARAGGRSGDLAQPTAQPTPTDVTTPAEPTPTEPTAAVAVAPFSLSRTDHSLSVQAVVRDQATKDTIIAEAHSLLDEGTTLDEKITIDPAVALPNPTTLAGLLRVLSTATGDAAVKYDGATVTLTGQVADQATKAAAARSAATAVPGAMVANQLRVPEIDRPPVTEACQTFQSRLTQLMRHNRIGFLSGTSMVNQQSQTSVVRAATLLKSCDSARVEVGGHTDNLGDPATSQPLSQRRADTVKTELVRLGVAADRITSRGYGQTRPLVSNTTSAGRIANRRVEIKTS